MDQLDLKGIIHFASQVAHIHVNYVGDALETLVPDVLEDHRAREDATGGGQQVFEQCVLLAGQLDVLAVTPHLARQAVDLQVGNQYHVGAFDRSSPQQRS